MNALHISFIRSLPSCHTFSNFKMIVSKHKVHFQKVIIINKHVNVISLTTPEALLFFFTLWFSQSHDHRHCQTVRRLCDTLRGSSVSSKVSTVSSSGLPLAQGFKILIGNPAIGVVPRLDFGGAEDLEENVCSASDTARHPEHLSPLLQTCL